MLSLFRNHKAHFAFSMVFGILTSAFTIAAAYLLESILNAVVNGDWNIFTTMLWIVLGYIVALILVVGCSALVEKKLIIKTSRDLRSAIQRGILSRDTEQYHKTNTADYLSALTNDIKLIEENIIVPFLTAIQYVILFIFAAVSLFLYSPVIGGILFGCLILMYLLPASLGKPIGKHQEAYSMGLSLFTMKLKDQFLGYDVIRSFRLTDRVKKDFAEQNENLASSKYAVDKLLAISEGIAQVIGAASQIGTMLVAGLLVFNGQMAAGALLAILQLSGAFVQPVSMIMQYIPMIQGATPVLTRLKALSAPTASAFQGTAEPVFAKAIRFENVGFSYVEGSPVLANMDGSIERGKKYVVAGESGCGKSTLIRLLCAEYSSYSGAIRVDDLELHDLNIDQLLTKISVIHQGVYMFDESIRHNIDLHRSYTEAEWERALSLSGVDKFLDKTESGLSSPVGEGGANLSGGQRQRIAVARALIEKKPILILDEGTSAVDIQTAYDIERALLEIDDLTMITITHDFRPELLRRYDAIWYMEQGRVVEAGSYDELLQMNGKFDAFHRIESEGEGSHKAVE